MNTVLFVTHKPKRCGVYDFGKNVFDCIKASQKFDFVKAECSSLNELFAAIETNKPEIIIYNYHPSVLPWITDKVFKGINRNNVSHVKAIQIGIIHEVTQELADNATSYHNKFIPGPFNRKLNSLFDFYIAADPTLLLKNPFVFKTGRLIQTYHTETTDPAITTIGSFGFGTPNKGFEDLVARVQEEFDEAIINFNIPTADFDDPQGENARKIAAECRSLIRKPGIQLNINHDFLSQSELLNFLSGNSMNCFFYKDKNGRGISSAVDYALAANKPLAITNCPMFRHVLAYAPEVSIEKNSLRNILSKGIAPIEPCIKEWQPANLVWDYERIIDAAILKTKFPRIEKMGIKRTVKAKIAKLITFPSPSFTWLRNTANVTDDSLDLDTNIQYEPIPESSVKYNRILNDEARGLYKNAIGTLNKLLPVTMAKKIA
ncbi:MAG: hypothetical protein ABIW38_05530, partial [Ferruginibacter sp.]